MLKHDFLSIIFRFKILCLAVFTSTSSAAAPIDVEMKDWFNEEIGRSQKLDFQCETIWDTRVYSTAKYSGLWILAYPQVDKKMKIVLGDAHILLDGQVERKSLFYGQESLWIEKTPITQFTIPIDIEDLQQFNEVKISFKVTDDKTHSDCVVTIHKKRIPLSRSPSVVYKRLPDLVAHFGLGGTPFRDSVVRSVSPTGMAASFGFLAFTKEHHGIGVNMSLAAYDNVSQLTRFTTTLSYAYRHFYRQNLGVTYSLGVGASMANQNSSQTTASLGVLQELFLDYYFNYNWGIGIGFNHTFSPGLNFGPHTLGGNEVGGLIRVVYGWPAEHP